MTKTTETSLTTKDKVPYIVPKPVAWQRRMRPDWGSNKDCWGTWEDCTESQAKECKQTPILHGQWAFESRALYVVPLTERQPLTEDQVFESNKIMEVNADIGLSMSSLMRIIRAIEAQHGIK